MRFSILSNGLQLGNDGRSVTKPLVSRFTTSCGQQTEPGQSTFHNATTVLSTKAFSATLQQHDDDNNKCDTSAPVKLLFEHQDAGTAEEQQSATSSSCSSSPNVLIGYSLIPHPHNNVATVDGEEDNKKKDRRLDGQWSQLAEQRRLLSTPLLWEEPHTVMLECSDRGAFLWSDALGVYGKKVWDQCFVKSNSEGASRWTAAVSMCLLKRPSVPSTENESSFEYSFKVHDPSLSSAVLATEKGTITCPADCFLTPVVTLIEPGCTATVYSN